MRLIKQISITASLVVGIALSGCSVTSGINSITGALTSPAANQAVANLKAGSQAVLCTIAGLANETNAVATAVNAKQAIIVDSQTAYVISGSLCTALGGTVGATVTVPAK